jgi:hypothetical protein
MQEAPVAQALLSNPKETKMAKKFDVVKSDEAVEQSIAKPDKFSLKKFKSTLVTHSVNIALNVLPIHSMADAKDFVRLHPTEWTDELCFCMVPIKGSSRDSLHLIEEEIAVQCLRPKKIIRQRLALASKPNDQFFLCIVPSQNLDNIWAISNLAACEKAKTLWTEAVSLRPEGKEGYADSAADDPELFGEPNWPAQSIDELIGSTLKPSDRMIDRRNHPALDRLLGRKSQVT